ncbi:MAG: PEP-CTERM sorting domain-containing protein [Acidobacteria bacterium]|nr:PEP-CTERM sorting domain-containing protein [Acidobacteriota bacterium]
MYWRKSALSLGLLTVVLLAGANSAGAAIITNGDAVGPNYTIQAIDPGVSVDFVATVPAAGNNNTIGKLTVTMSHLNLFPLSFRLTENAAATVTSGASAGLRLLLDVRDTNGMVVPWFDYHIHAEDNAEDVRAIQALFGPGEGSHLVAAHFHDSTTGFGSNPLVILGLADNVVDLNYGLGAMVNPGQLFSANNILLHERDFAGFQRDFQVTFTPSVPEPATFALAALGIAAIGLKLVARK